MVVLEVVVFAAGAVVVWFTLASALRTMVLPRGIPARLARIVFVSMRWVFRLRAGRRASYERRDRVMAFYAPISLLALLSTWLVLVLFGYWAMFWALGTHPVRAAFTVSGSSIFTLGFSHTEGLSSTILSFTEAGLGLGLLALLITYLPSLYNAFSRREGQVAKLEVRAGRPPSGVRLIELSWIVGHLEQLHEVWEAWEDWFVDVEESHTSFPALSFFRSPQPDRSWITAAGALLDGASLLVSSVDVPHHPEPEFCIRAGYLCLRRIATFFGIPYDPDPAPEDPITVRREEYDAAYDRLAAAGVPLEADRDQAWRDFAGWRVNYDTVLVALARLTMAPQAPWSSDRVPDVNYIPPLFGLRRRARALTAGLPTRQPRPGGER